MGETIQDCRRTIIITTHPGITNMGVTIQEFASISCGIIMKRGNTGVDCFNQKNYAPTKYPKDQSAHKCFDVTRPIHGMARHPEKNFHLNFSLSSPHLSSFFAPKKL